MSAEIFEMLVMIMKKQKQFPLRIETDLYKKSVMPDVNVDYMKGLF